jgi:NADPH2:quinone reductase
VTYGGLVVRGGLKKGETVLVTAAAGGLGLAAVQIAKAVGARVIAAAGSETKLDVAKRFGADECVNYTNCEDWWKGVLEKTNGKGVDVVYDPVGMVDKSLKCLKPKGRIIVIGFAGREGNMERIAMNRVLLRQAQIIGYVSLSFLSKRKGHSITRAALRYDRSYRPRGDEKGMGRCTGTVGKRTGGSYDL